MKKLKLAILKSLKSLWRVLPIILTTILIVGLFSALIPKSFYTAIFRQNVILNSFTGAAVGSISAGNPITSYILGGEFLKQGINLIVVTAFLVSWVTVGIIQIPAESTILGRKFAFLRNFISFVFSLIIAVLAFMIISKI